MVRLLALLFLGVVAACTPELPDATSIVTSPRLLAVQASPAEAAVGASFTLTALYVDPSGAVADASAMDWATCLLANPLGDPAPVNAACFAHPKEGLTELGRGGKVTGTIPMNACELFGPESPPPAQGQPAPRPTDPDSTGGFYLPIRVVEATQQAVALERITCQPSGVVLSVFTAWSTGYVPNENPRVSAVSLVSGDGGVTSLTGAAAPIVVSAGKAVTLRALWPTCPSKPAACRGAETYLYIDASTKQLATGRESIVASWYATDGSFALDRAGRDGTDLTTSADNTWIAPSTGGLVRFWVVLRDARGGVGWASYALSVGAP